MLVFTLFQKYMACPCLKSTPLAFYTHSPCYLHPVLYTLIHPVLYALIPCFQEMWVSVSCDVMAALSAPPQHTRLHLSRSLLCGKTTVLVNVLGTGCRPPVSQPVLWVRIGSGSRRAKMTHKNRKRLINFIFWSASCFLLRSGGFSYRLDVLYVGLGISKLQFLFNIQKSFIFFFFSFWSWKPWIRNKHSAIGKLMSKNSNSGAEML